jgi:hypothetical protein
LAKGITIEDIQGDDWSHAIRFYSGNDDERYAGLITEIQDADFNQSHSLIIAPPQTIPGERISLNDGVRLRGRNANLLSNASFENAYTAIATNADFENIKFAIGFINANRSWDTVNFTQGWGTHSLRMTSVASGYCFFWHHLLAYKFPELIGQTKLTVSAWVRNDSTTGAAKNAGFFITTYDADGANTSAIPALNTLSNVQSIPNDGQWYRISQTMDFTSVFPSGFPDTTNIWEIGFGFNATAAGQIFNIDDIQLEIGDTLTDFKPQTPTSYFMPGAGMILGNTLVISDRIKSFDEMTNTKWNPQLDYEAANPSIQLENDGMVGMLEKWSGLNVVSGNINESYLALRVLDDQGVIQGPWLQIKDSNDEVNPNTIQILNQQRQLMGYWGSMADPTNPEANASAKDLVVSGAFRAAGTPLWSAPNSLGSGVSNAGGLYGFSSFNSNGITYLRGTLTSTGGTSAGAALAVIPTEHRPQVAVDFVAGKLPSSGAPAMVVCQIDTAGTLKVIRGAFTGIALGETLMFDGLCFSTANPTPVISSGGGNPATIGPATAPSAFTITPYASSLTTGTYRLGWTNASDADNAKVRIVWRVDRAPASATDGNIVTVTTVNGAAQSYLLSGLPVGRRIYIKLFAINKAGVVNTAGVSNSRFLLASPTVVYANSSASYRDGYGGMWRNDGDQVYQGEWTGNDNHRGLFFYGTQISDRLNLGSVARTPTKMTIYLQRTGSGGIYGAVPIDLYPTALATKPSGVPAIVTTQTAGSNIVSLKTNQGATITIPALWYPVYTTGVYKGFAIYNTGSDYAVLYGRSTNSAHGKLTIYHKG